ncbi:MAG TPA: S53 family peptidase [Thiobacillaceae bacterium]|nr:S53 family peptidase [Thiobacillaceae bacterium]
MAVAKQRKSVPGSEKRAVPNARLIGEVDETQRIEVTVMVRARSSGAGVRALTKSRAEVMNMGAKLPEQRRYLSREEFAAQRGADPDDIEKVENFALAHKLTVVHASADTRSLRLSGSLGDLIAAFRPRLKQYRSGNRVFRGRTGPISVPHELADIVVGVFGFDDRPVAKPHCRFLDDSVLRPGKKRSTAKGGKTGSRTGPKAATPRNAAGGSFTPRQVAGLYNFPAGLDGSGQCIAVIELNDFDRRNKITGTGFNPMDLAAYFKSLGLPPPKVTAIGVDGGANMPGPDPNADGEVMLDIEVAGAVAPGAQIAVYFAPNTDQGFIDAISSAIHDRIRKPSVISISWGGPEEAWTQQALNAFDQVLQDAAALGVTVCCSAGDDGSSDIRDPQQRDGKPHVDFPAASPFALACGGTRLLASATGIAQESVWKAGDGATGGGVSNFAARPPYQAKAKVPKSPTGKPGRGVPDVAGDADPETGYQIRLVGGKSGVIGGTSAVSPLWAGLMALVNQRLARKAKSTAGFINPLLYSLLATAGAFHDIVKGDNDLEGLGKYKARRGWDPCTGLGTANGSKLLAALGA